MEHVHGVDIYDIYDVTYSPWWLQTWFFITCSVAGVILIGGLLYWWYSNRQKKVLNHYERMLEELCDLEDLIDEAQDAYTFYSLLTDLLKAYCFSEYDISSGVTDEELLKILKNRSDISQFVVHAVQDILEGIEVIKFGRGTAVIERMQKSLNNMKKIITGTMLMKAEKAAK